VVAAAEKMVVDDGKMMVSTVKVLKVVV